MTQRTDVDVLMIGHFAKDQNIVDGEGETASGGGVYFGSVALRRLGLSVAIVTRLHPDDFPRLEELKREGVQVFAAADAPGEIVDLPYEWDSPFDFSSFLHGLEEMLKGEGSAPQEWSA